MNFEKLQKLFLHSRARGITGAKKKCRPRTIEGYVWALEHFFDWMEAQRGILSYESMTKIDVLDFLEWVDSREAWSKATKLKILRSLRTLFIWVGNDEDCNAEALKSWAKCIPPIEKSPRREYIPNQKEIRKFEAEFNVSSRWGYRDFVAHCLMLDTGMRVGEVCHLKVSDVKLDDAFIIVPEEGKTGTRKVPLTEQMIRHLKGWQKRRGLCPTGKKSEYLFVTKYKDKCTPGTFQQSFKKAAKRAKGGNITPHTHRHAFCTYFLVQDGNIAKLKAITGHKSIGMLLDYEHLAQLAGKQLQDELERVSPLKYLGRKEP